MRTGEFSKVNWFIGIIGFVLIATYVSYPFVIQLIIKSGWTTRGQFGDSFGSLNSLFTGVTIIMLVYTVLIQRIELRYTVKEFKRSADAQEQSQKALQMQAETLKIQSFENTFFNLFDIHLKVCQELHYGVKARGKGSFSILSNDISNHMKEPKKFSLEFMKNKYLAFHTYTSSLRNIFNYIDTYFPTNDITNQRLYFEFLFGQFTPAEWVVFNFYVERLEKSIEEKYINKYDLDRLNPTEYKRESFTLS